jgi:hypothetical protein
MIIFHRVLIGTAMVFFAGMALWALAAYRADGATSLLALGLFAAAAAVLLVYYLKNLRRFLGR